MNDSENFTGRLIRREVARVDPEWQYRATQRADSLFALAWISGGAALLVLAAMGGWLILRAMAWMAEKGAM